MQDISDILAFAKDKLASTNYAGFPFNAVLARRTLKAAMKSADSRVWVAHGSAGRIAGFLIGEIGPMPMTHYMSATDLAFLATGGGSQLVDAFIAWCRLRGVARIDMGISAGMDPRQQRAITRLLRRKGLLPSGGMFHLNLLGESQ